MSPPRRAADIGGEAALIAGGARAILLQLANPAIGHSVAVHSDFAAQPIRRLVNTLSYAYALIYGSPAQIATVQAMVNRAHQPVKSAAGETPAYDARDPALQLWVAATLYDTAVLMHQRVVGRLSAADLDQIYADYAVIGTSLQIVGESLCEAVDIRAGQSVLDVAAGNGNATLAAARRWCDVTSTDYVPALLEKGRARAAAAQ